MLQILFVLGRPSESPQHNCPQNITEGDTIDCLCYSENLGAPSGSLIWKGTNSSRLKIDNVNRTYSGTSHICYLMWNNSAVQNSIYTVTVNCKLTHSAFGLVSSSIFESSQSHKNRYLNEETIHILDLFLILSNKKSVQ